MRVQQGELGVAVVGTGVGEAHARAFLANPSCRLRWIFDVDRARSHKLSERLEAGAVAERYDQILQDREVQVVSVASYDDAHYEQTIRALEAGKHVFVEKPLCRSIEELRHLKRAWEASGARHLASNLILRASPLFQWVKGLITQGAFGQIYAIDGDYLYGRLHKITEGWRKGVKDYSVMQGGGVHLVDLMIWLVGEQPNTVMAMGNQICTKGTGFQYNDYAAATYRFPSGLVGRITANFGCVHHHQHGVRIFGTGRTFISDDMGPRLHTSRDPTAAPLVPDLPALPPTKGALIPQFIESIVNGYDTREQIQHDFNVISACVAADQAMKTARPLSIIVV